MSRTLFLRKHVESDNSNIVLWVSEDMFLEAGVCLLTNKMINGYRGSNFVSFKYMYKYTLCSLIH